MSLSFSWFNFTFTFFAFKICFRALNLKMILLVLSKKSHAAALRTWYHLKLAWINMDQGICIMMNFFTLRFTTLELNIFQTLFYKSIYLFNIYIIVSFALLGTGLVAISPCVKACPTKQGFTPSTLNRVFNYIGTDWTGKVISSLFGFIVFYNHVIWI